MNEDQTPLEFLHAVYRNETVSLGVRIRAATEALPFVHPKLAVTALVAGQDIAALLDQRSKKLAQERSEQTNSGPPQIPDHRR
jgi:hypothetical protein